VARVKVVALAAPTPGGGTLRRMARVLDGNASGTYKAGSLRGE